MRVMIFLIMNILGSILNIAILTALEYKQFDKIKKIYPGFVELILSAVQKISICRFIAPYVLDKN